MVVSKLETTPDPESLFREAELAEESGNLREAFESLSAAARMGHVGSQLNLGNYFAWGRGVKRNLKRAAFWYTKAYRQGDSTAAQNLAIDRLSQGKIRSAVAWFKKAIAMNNGEACVALAKVYRARKGGQKASEELLRRAVKLSRDDISESARDEARSLLERSSKRRGRP